MSRPTAQADNKKARLGSLAQNASGCCVSLEIGLAPHSAIGLNLPPETRTLRGSSWRPPAPHRDPVYRKKISHCPLPGSGLMLFFAWLGDIPSPAPRLCPPGPHVCVAGPTAIPVRLR